MIESEDDEVSLDGSGRELEAVRREKETEISPSITKNMNTHSPTKPSVPEYHLSASRPKASSKHSEAVLIIPLFRLIPLFFRLSARACTDAHAYIL